MLLEALETLIEQLHEARAVVERWAEEDADRPGAERVLFEVDYRGRSGPVPPWQTEQEPEVEGERQDRITVVEGGAVPGDSGPPAAMRVELRPFDDGDGDVQNDDFNRAEVYGRHADPSSVPAREWPDPVGSTRWYELEFYLPSNFEFDESDRRWLTIVQWKGLHSGVPSLAIGFEGDRMVLGGKRAGRDLGAATTGAWEKLLVGVHFSPDDGWVEVWRNGAEVLPRWHRATMNMRTVGGEEIVDPSYLKQGIYRSKEWDVTHVVYFGPTRIVAGFSPR